MSSNQSVAYVSLIALCILFVSGFSHKSQINVGISGETSIEFVQRYVDTINENATSEVYKSFWGIRANKYILNNPDRTERELFNATAFHRIISKDSTLATQAEINEWGDEQGTISFQYTLNNPVLLSLPDYPKSGETPWTGYQITVEMESDKWVVSGETLTR